MTGKSTDVGHSRNTVKRLLAWAGFVTTVLMIPFLTNMPWTGSDFIFAGAVLFGAALGYELATSSMKDATSRLFVGAAVVAMVLFIWALAVAD
jgi:hypothetical protein